MDAREHPTGGIPIGNTVAVVGDPGTGKTSLLLSFFRYGIRSGNGVILHHGGGTKGFQDAFHNFNRLLKPRTSGATNAEQSPKVLRCFVSLENSHGRLQAHHEELLGSTSGSDEILLLIDASSLLSGRLEDRLRYAPLGGRNDADTQPNELHLAPCGSKADSGNRCLYWQDENGKAVPWEQALQNHGSGLLQKEKINDRPIVLSLLTPPVASPGERVRLLKDLLAALFLHFRDYGMRVLALDSLSALLHSFDEEDREAMPSLRRLGMLNLVRWLEEQEVTTFMACEARRTEHNTLRGHPLFLGTEERYLASGVIQLDYHRYRSGDLVRYLRILKMRGAAHDMRPHAYDLDEHGIAWLEPLFGEAQQGGFHE